jgi:thiol:disulfide interchange protein DsbD
VAILLAAASPAQTSGVITAADAPRLFAKKGATVESKLRFRLQDGYHVNSSAPSDPYLIPLRLTWNDGPVKVTGTVYPEGHLENYAFSETPLSVITNNFDIVTRLQIPADAPKGSHTLTAKLRYQACNNTTCLPPRTLEVKQQIDIR